MTDQEHFALKQLIKFHFFTSLAISLAANWAVTDLLMLKMDFDLAKFGVVKGNMFLVPAVSYFLVSGFLGRLNKDIQICQWGYFLRVALPIVLPLLALTDIGKETLLWVTAGIMAVGYTCAMFANNTLLKIMQNTLPAGELNKRAVFLNSLLGVPGALLCIPAVWFLTRAGSEPKVFLIWFAILQTTVVLFEYPAIRAIGKIKMPQLPIAAQNKAFPFRHVLTRNLCMLFSLTILHGIWMGLCATYFVVYLLKNDGISPSTIMWIEAGLSVFALLAGPCFGKLVDKWGYPLTMTACSALIAAVSFLWVRQFTFTPVLFLFCATVYNGNNGFLSSMLRQSEGLASVRLAPPACAEFSVGLGALLFALGTVAGCFFAGSLYTHLNGSLEEYFRWCARGPVIMFLLSAVWLAVARRSAMKGKENESLENAN